MRRRDCLMDRAFVLRSVGGKFEVKTIYQPSAVPLFSMTVIRWGRMTIIRLEVGCQPFILSHLACMAYYS